MSTGSSDRKEKVKIWSLDDNSLVKTFNPIGNIESLFVVDLTGKKILACGNGKGVIKLWSLDDYKCIQTIRTHSRTIFSLRVIQCNGKVCLVSSSRDCTM